MIWKKNSFREEFWLLLIDKVFIGVLIGAVSFGAYRWSESIKEEIEERRNQEQLELAHATLASQLLPTIADTTLAVDDRARLLSVLSNADAIQPHTAAQYGQKFIEDGVSKHIFVQAISPSIQLEAEPFLRETALIVWKHIRHLSKDEKVPDCNIAYRGSKGSPINDLKLIRLNESEEAAGLSHWRAAFAAYLDPNIQASVRDQLNSEKFLTERVPIFPEQLEDVKFKLTQRHFYILAFLLAPRSMEKARELANSDVLAIKLIGHMALVSWPLTGYGIVTPEDSLILQSHEFVSKRLRRKPSDISDVELLDAEISVLSNSRYLFNRPLAGKIAIPLAELFTTSDYFGVQQSAGNTLLSMADCGIEAQSILIDHLNQLLNEFNALKRDQLVFWQDWNSFDMDKLGYLLARLRTEDVAASMKPILEIPNNKLRFFSSSLKQDAERVIADVYLRQAGRLIVQEDYETARDEMNKLVALQKNYSLTMPYESLYNYAMVALSLDSTKVAIDALNKYLSYLSRERKEGRDYKKAQELLNKANKMADKTEDMNGVQ